MTDVETPEETRRVEPDYWFRLTIEAPRYGFVPHEMQHHLTNARREVLLALRSLIDAAIERTEREGHQRSRRAAHIEVE